MKTCTAYWRFPSGEEWMCGDPAPHPVADAYFCDCHYERALIWAAEAGRTEGSLVYYIQRESDSLIKIGTSRMIVNRWTELRNEHGPILLFAVHQGAHREEHMVHVAFAGLRVEGEWFRPELPLLEHILKARKTIARTPEGLPAQLDLLELGRMVRRLKRQLRAASGF